MLATDAEIIGALYDGIVDSERLTQAIMALARRFACESASIVSFDPVLPEAAVVLAAGAFDAAAQRRYNDQFAAHDPAPAAFAARPSGTAIASDRLFSPDYLRKSVMLHEFLRPLGIEETLGGTVTSRDGRFAFLTVHRGKDRLPFDDDDIASVERLLPHIQRALQLRRTFVRQEAKMALMASMIDRLSVGVVILNGEGTAEHVNHAAHAIAERQDGIWFDQKGRPHASDRAAELILARYRNGAKPADCGGIAQIPRHNDQPPYAVLVAPLPTSVGVDFVPGGHARGTLILIHDPDVQTSSSADAIATIFGLPKGAARLVAALVQGEDAKTYAERHGVTYDTIRFHLKNAYARTGVRNQARLLQLVTRALTEFSKRK